jgi:RNA 2',3'-cyclic 3'-phosphodiesterase
MSRLFFGAHIEAPWPTRPRSKEKNLGRVLEQADRHLTFAFLGDTSLEQLKSQLTSFPAPDFPVGPVGICDKLLFLPEKTPRVAAYHIEWLSQQDRFNSFQQSLAKWLAEKKYPVDDRPFQSHVTQARAPFERTAWKELFTPLPAMMTSIHLYESVGDLHYNPVWSQAITPPFIELDHTADIAFQIQGEAPQQLHLHAQIALCFHFPALLPFLSKKPTDQLEPIVMDLNRTIAKADAEIGCPFKAVSFHGSIKPSENGLLTWEMIVDV